MDLLRSIVPDGCVTRHEQRLHTWGVPFLRSKKRSREGAQVGHARKPLEAGAIEVTKPG